MKMFITFNNFSVPHLKKHNSIHQKHFILRLKLYPINLLTYSLQHFSYDDNWTLLEELDSEVCKRYKQKFKRSLDNCYWGMWIAEYHNLYAFSLYILST